MDKANFFLALVGRLRGSSYIPYLLDDVLKSLISAGSIPADTIKPELITHLTALIQSDLLTLLLNNLPLKQEVKNGSNQQQTNRPSVFPFDGIPPQVPSTQQPTF